MTMALVAVLVTSGPASAVITLPETFTVNTTGSQSDTTPDGTCDSTTNPATVHCTLMEAIQEANANNNGLVANTIAFNIPIDDDPAELTNRCNTTTKVCTIYAAAPLPIIEPVIIDGYTQGDATSDTTDDAKENTLTQPGKTNAVLKIELSGEFSSTGTDGLIINAPNSVIRGLVINRFDPGASGILLQDTKGNRIEGNFIGTDPSGTQDLGNDVGVLFSDTGGSTIGGTSHEARNLISGNGTVGSDSFVGGIGVWLQDSSSGNNIQGNLIGTDKDGGPLGNRLVGVSISPGPGNDNPGGNRILSNSIFSNGGLA